MATSAYLDDQSEQVVKKIKEAGDFDSCSEVVKESLKLLEKQLREKRLAEKYRREKPISTEAMRAQEETLSDLDD